MKVSVQFPLHTKSENANRRYGHPMARANATARERRDVRMFLDSQLPKLRSRVPTGEEHPIDIEKRKPDGPSWKPVMQKNFFRVTIVRISAGMLDSDNVHGAVKAVRDEVAAWLGIDDGDLHAASWRVAQQKCPGGFWAVRIEIEDDDPDQREIVRICGPTIPHLGPLIGDCSHCGRPARAVPPEEMRRAVAAVKRIYGRPARVVMDRTLDEERAQLRRETRAVERAMQARQEKLTFRRSFYALPEEQEGEDAVLHELPARAGIADPPATMTVKRRGERLTLRRRLCKDFPELGEIWLYEVPESSPRAVTTTEERTEATRCPT